MEHEKELMKNELQQKLDKMSREWMFQDQIRKIRNFDELNKAITPGGIVFAGDSITEGFPVNELIDSELPLYNRGISGITSSQLLENLKSHILDLDPSKVFLLIGTNDVAFEILAKKTVENLEQICLNIIEANPAISIYLISVYPVNENMASVGARSNKMIQEINHQIFDRISTIPNITFIDMVDILSVNGQLSENYTHDGLHLSIKGYQVVSKELNKYL